MSRKLLYLLCGLLLCLFSACSTKTIFSEYQHIPLKGWQSDSAFVFQVVIPDTTIGYDILFFIRHTQQYRYQNMWLFIDQDGKKDTISTILTDTIEFYLADERGRWLGNGYGNIREMPILYKQNISINFDTLTLSIKQAMRDDLLVGISEVGVKIVEHEQE